MGDEKGMVVCGPVFKKVNIDTIFFSLLALTLFDLDMCMSILWNNQRLYKISSSFVCLEAFTGHQSRKNMSDVRFFSLFYGPYAVDFVWILFKLHAETFVLLINANRLFLYTNKTNMIFTICHLSVRPTYNETIFFHFFTKIINF